MSLLFSRRDVLKTLLVGSVTSRLGKTLWASPLTAASTGTGGLARIRLADFPPLAADGGSVRLASSALQPGDAGPEGNFYPIIINRISASEYVALPSACLHSGCVIGRYNGDEFHPGVMYCPCHETQYDIRGTVVIATSQAPGLLGEKLIPYPSALANGVLTIDLTRLPGIVFEIFPELTAIANGRLRITWFSLPGNQYEVRYQRKVGDFPEAVLFSETADGPMDEEFMTSPGGAPTAYVAAREGIYQVALHLADI